MGLTARTITAATLAKSKGYKLYKDRYPLGVFTLVDLETGQERLKNVTLDEIARYLRDKPTRAD